MVSEELRVDVPAVPPSAAEVERALRYLLEAIADKVVERYESTHERDDSHDESPRSPG